MDFGGHSLIMSAKPFSHATCNGVFFFFLSASSRFAFAAISASTAPTAFCAPRAGQILARPRTHTRTNLLGKWSAGVRETFWQAKSIGVTSSVALLFTSPPASTSRAMHAGCPAHAARCMAVRPRLSRSFASGALPSGKDRMRSNSVRSPARAAPCKLSADMICTPASQCFAEL